MRWHTICTRNALINGNYTLIKNNSKYLVPKEIAADYGSLSDEILMRILYRRFMRLRPFVSCRKMVRDTYTDYLRYKFKVEDYDLKRSLIFKESSNASVKEQVWNSLTFVTKAVTYLPETAVVKWDLARDNTTCRQILKNILTMEYQKASEIGQAAKRKSKSNPYSDLKLRFNHIRNCDSSASFRAFGEFDISLLYLNEMLRTRL
ncbi:hypothetical protein HG536_0D03820 [Torulaspora globosa]|uniref:Uncharacterized protein n=1 Tax=Torulaspora globosa TaxID=48254 RepID=A0A7G3ZH74_9SACH|nr:uncharacterized protein HG536_0D03820 [Torulaspora globosa]QLL32860.1 hypothetical protein HG536_0D03820 [Torulaspora globosa]